MDKIIFPDKIEISPYELIPRKSLGDAANLDLQAVSKNAHKGVLLKCTFSEFGTGYSDLSPWVVFGDLDLNSQLEYLKQKKKTALIIQSLNGAYRDAEARANNISLYKDFPLENHYLISNFLDCSDKDIENILTQGFDKVKIKLNSNFHEAATKLNSISKLFRLSSKFNTRLNPNLNSTPREHFNSRSMQSGQEENRNIRLDFNAQLLDQDFFNFVNLLSEETKSKIEFIEDPTKFNSEMWRKFNTSIPIALDNELGNDDRDAYSYRIFKPAKQKIPSNVDRPFVVTSYMDHPIGIAHAFVCAQDQVGSHFYRGCGLLTYGLYNESSYSKQFSRVGSQLSMESHFGIGFDEFLEKENWIRLI